jgi:hypothetical protein
MKQKPTTPVNLTDVCFEVVKRKLCILANLNQIAVWIAHVATPFPDMVVERLSEKGRAFVTPLVVIGPNVRDSYSYALKVVAD